MKTIQHYATARDKLLHVETEGAVVNIRVGLSDRFGHAVTSVEIAPDGPLRGGDGQGRVWVLDGAYNNRLVRLNQDEPVPEEPRENAVIRQAALAYLHGEDPEDLSLADLADALGVPHENVEALDE